MRFTTLFLTAVVFSALAVAQTPVLRPGYYGCGPYIPLVTTPEVSFETVAPSPVGASNATYGLVAGATNATLSIVQRNLSPTYTQPVWFRGGTTPLVSSPQVELPALEMPMVGRGRAEPEHERAEARAWTYLASEEATSSPVEAAQSAKAGKRASRTYTNQDIERQNQTNGLVKYHNKTEPLK